MDNVTKKRLKKGSLRITGNSTARGGSYENVRIVGEAEIDGDVDCSQLKCMGTLDMDGHLRTGRMSIMGTGTFSGRVQADSAKISGTVTVGGDVHLKEFHCMGTMETNGNLRVGQLKLTGQLHVKGDCEAEVFSARGIFDVEGLINVGRMDVKLYMNCSAKEIGGEKIRVKRASLLNPFSFFFKPSPHARLSVSVIEGDEIELEYTKADIVRGGRVNIGPGCEIGLVEYKQHFTGSRNAVIGESRRV